MDRVLSQGQVLNTLTLHCPSLSVFDVPGVRYTVCRSLVSSWSL